MKISTIAIGLALLLSAASLFIQLQPQKAEVIVNPALKASGFPLSDAVEINGLLFLSGKLGTVPGGGGLAPGGITAETQQTMENIKTLLASRGLGMEHIVKCTAMLADMAEWPAFNAAYKDYFSGDYPARSAFAVSGLAAKAHVEIECIAQKP